MNRSRRSHAVPGTAAIFLMVIGLACTMPAFFLSGIGALMAWADYADRGCPYGVQCEDAVDVMWIAGLVSLTCVTIALRV
ncbi:hypothetical protein J2J97_13055 [Rhizobium bangladeshense]|uniref:hypothetical protein n=1 Tax=Rhizobium TaxID=379 RepID=UPI001106BEFA|nr:MULTISPECIES: hypothetical protein [Rhizobium]MBX4888837.1 hypothetical protein [Rhizobium bangladeshense]MBX4924014.1 hypothetical protein [Rhizobium bangladeshense]QSY92973.1 hypothetical protein J2J97_13055 [Rhizobium bangladeshense]TLX14429.1 hypothetical protein FFR93_11770 [Rhizobium sp. MHM7A]